MAAIKIALLAEFSDNLDTSVSLYYEYVYALSQKSVPSLAGYSFNTHSPIFVIFGTCNNNNKRSK